MSPTDRWDRLWAVFHDALDRADAERAEWVAARCDDDGPLRDEVMALLRTHLADPDFLESSLRSGMPEPAREDDETLVGRKLGRYTVLRLLARGGTGIVWEAEQDTPRRRVALKLLHPAVGDASATRRVEYEARILARLRHPGIAQVYEVGTFDLGFGARPFIAMELIDGAPLTDAAESRGLSLDERVRLLVAVCEAVHFAHQRGVIHLDLKPANILAPNAPGVDNGRPHVKVVDFGVARLIEGAWTRTLITAPQQIAGTLPYMSPEQIAGDTARIDTLSDVYALGVVAYQLLAGRLPYELGSDSIFEAVRVMRETTPRPLGLPGRKGGELATVVAAAMEHDPARRYASAAELGADLKRVLTDEPILVRPPSRAYQVRRFARRNKTLVSAVVATVLALSLGLGIAAFQAVRARRAETEAQQTADDVQRLVAQILFEIEPMIARLPGSKGTRRQIVSDMLAYLHVLQDREAGRGDAQLLAAIADAHEGLGRALGGLDHDNTRAAQENHRAALTIRERLLVANPDDVTLLYGLARSYFWCSRTFEDVDRETTAAGAIVLLDKSLDTYARIADLPAAQLDYGDALVIGGLGKKDRAMLDGAVAMLRDVAAEREDDASRAALANALRGQAVQRKNLGDPPASYIDALREALDIQDTLVADSPTDTARRTDLQRTCGELALAMTALGDTDGGVNMGRRAVDIAERLIDIDPDDPDAFRLGEVACDRMVQVHEIVAEAADAAGAPRLERLARWMDTLRWAERLLEHHLQRKERNWVTVSESHYEAEGRAYIERFKTKIRSIHATN